MLFGRLVDGEGTPKVGAQVTVFSSQRVICQATTDNQGVFALRMEKGGLYALSDNRAFVLARLWTNRAAPPSAIERILIVSNEDTVRAQVSPRSPFMEATILTVAGAGVIWHIVANWDAS